jgi:hypothetical protein
VREGGQLAVKSAGSAAEYESRVIGGPGAPPRPPLPAGGAPYLPRVARTRRCSMTAADRPVLAAAPLARRDVAGQLATDSERAAVSKGRRSSAGGDGRRGSSVWTAAQSSTAFSNS